VAAFLVLVFFMGMTRSITNRAAQVWAGPI